MKRRVTIGLICLSSLAVAADIRGTISIEQALTRRNVTPATGLYQRGVAVELKSDEPRDPISFERSHVAVYLEDAPAGEDATGALASIQQLDRRFLPDLVVIPAGSSVSFPNFDPIFHNVFSLSKAKSFDLGNYPKGQSRTVTFPKPGIVAVYCHLHPNMSASIVVTPSRWGAKAEPDGNFSFKDVPPGRYTVVAWHKAAGTFRKTIEVRAGQTTDINFTLPYVDPGSGARIAAHSALSHP